ncbi:MAG: hypothetical protein O3A87_12110 [Verrucomicrobia bacterium]|nr:hypothetical protein [Verrucomicrobiota bacterium]MDA1007207.1 hypothetical protein [Verrucomicrobiota bacterium]
MSRSALVILALIGVGFMIAKNMLMGGEKLLMEDGKSAALVLPADKAAAEVAYQTATFGLG